MTICAEDPKEWSMCLVKYDTINPPCFSRGSLEEKFCFKCVRVDNEIITGRVYDKDSNQAYLTGTCSPFDHQSKMARMSFFFQGVNENDPTKKINVFLTGWGYQPEGGNPIFFGGFVALAAPAPNQDPVPNPDCEPVPVLLPPLRVGFDDGDTGTGTGMQAQCSLQIPE